jgi:hypothetical protein
LFFLRGNKEKKNSFRKIPKCVASRRGFRNFFFLCVERERERERAKIPIKQNNSSDFMQEKGIAEIFFY